MLQSTAMDTDTSTLPSIASENGDMALSETSEKKVETPSMRAWVEENNYDPKLIFKKLFGEDIEYLLSMKHLWKERRPPKPLVWEEVPDSSRVLKG